LAVKRLDALSKLPVPLFIVGLMPYSETNLPLAIFKASIKLLNIVHVL